MHTDDDFERVLLQVKRDSRHRLNAFIGLVVGSIAYVVIDAFGYLINEYDFELSIGGGDYETYMVISLVAFCGLAYLLPPLLGLLSFLWLSPEQRRREWALFGDVRARRLRVATSTVSMLSVLVVVVYVLLGAEAQRWSLQPAHLLDGGVLRLRSLLTYGLWHADVPHLVLNVAGLFGFGLIVDVRLGRLRTLALCVVAVLAGGAAEAIVRAGEDVWIVGISAAIYAVAVARIVLMPSRRIATAVVSLPQWMVLLPVLVWFVVSDVVFSTHVAVYANLAGVVVGAAGGFLWRGLPEPADFTDAEAVYQAALQAEEG